MSVYYLDTDFSDMDQTSELDGRQSLPGLPTPPTGRED